MRIGLLIVTVAVMFAAAAGDAQAATPFWNRVAHRRAHYSSWHGHYYHVAWGQPVALLVPPTAEVHTDWGWGVSGTQIRPTWHQFGRPFPGPIYSGGHYMPTPHWPSDTSQFGVYYVRGPW